jgi:hypothetical protein
MAEPTGATDRNTAFHLATNMKIYGGFAGTENAIIPTRCSGPNITIISGDFADDGFHRKWWHVCYYRKHRKCPLYDYRWFDLFMAVIC